MKYTKSGGQPKSGGDSNNRKWKYKIAMIEKDIRNQKRQLSVYNTAANPGSDDEESDGLEKEYGNRKHCNLTRKVKSKSSKKAWHGTPQSIDCGESVGGCNKVAKISKIKVERVQSTTSLQSNESAMEIDNHVDTIVLGSNCLPIHDFGRSVDVSGWDASEGSFEFPKISWAISYDHPTNVQVDMLVYHQAIQCPRFTSHLMCSMQSRITGVRINDLPKFLAKEPYDKTNTIIVNDPLNPNAPVHPVSIEGGHKLFPV